MAAYAALVSVVHIIDQIQLHPRPPISLEKIQIQSLTEILRFFQKFLENYHHGGSKEADELENRIADEAYAAEDVIESHIVDQITGGSTSQRETEEPSIKKTKVGSSVDIYQALQKVIEGMILIKKEVMDITGKARIFRNNLTKSSVPASSLILSGQATMVGCDDLLFEIMDKLTGGQLDRQIIPIYGMGGIGKTTLARNIFVDEIIVHHFDIRGRALISQHYSIREILSEIICQENREYKKHLIEMSEYDLGEMLHRRLCGRRYLIVMDDIWDIDVWDKVSHFFPDNNNGSRILITTRLSNVAFQLNQNNGLKMKFLDEEESWKLLCRNVFVEEDCPLELEDTGKRIAKNCRGLPLSIVVIGRVLAKSEQTQEYWEYIAENLSSIVNLDDDEHCLKILNTSYNQLPVYLKPCFLYIGIFSEDIVIRVSSLVKLWVVEGFLKPIRGKSLEAVAEEYICDLVDRNLIFIREWGSNGKIKLCNIHDLLRDLCLRQAQKEKFICIASRHNSESAQGMNIQHRVAFDRSTNYRALQSLQSWSHVRTLICDFDGDLPLLEFRLLRLLDAYGKDTYYGITISLQSLEAIFSKLINLRHLAITIDNSSPCQLLPSSLHLLWNLQTLNIDHEVDFIAPSEIWEMPQLRHVEFWSLELPNPTGDVFVLGNLQTLLRIKNFRCCEEVVKRTPHIKKLWIEYDSIEGWSGSCFDNLDHLKVESFYCIFTTINWSNFLQSLTFPHSIKKLCLKGCRLPWEDVTTKIGSLPVLEVLKLEITSTKGYKWETVDGGFPRLKFLRIGSFFDDLECWITESSHFPVLQHLVLVQITKLEKIPSELGNIATLKFIDLNRCCNSVIFSAKEILDEQEEFGNEEIQVRVRLENDNQDLESFKSRNFQIQLVQLD